MKVEAGIDIFILYLIAVLIFLHMRVSLQLLLRGEERMVLWRVENA